MGGRAPQGDYEPAPPLLPPSALDVALVALVVFVVLVANGRPIGAGDTRPTERVAASLVQSFDFDLDEFPEVEAPFARQSGAHKVSIYPVLSAVLATPVFAACRTLFALDETGSALAGKLAAALFSSLAAAVFFVALARSHPLAEARTAALLLALGTSVFSTSQALWQHPAAVLFLSVLLLFVFRAFDDDVWAGRAGLPWALALAARHADVALLLPLAIGIAVRWPRRIASFALWAAPPLALLAVYQLAYFGSPLGHGFSGGLAARFNEPWGRGQLGLLAVARQGAAGVHAAGARGDRGPRAPGAARRALDGDDARVRGAGARAVHRPLERVARRGELRPAHDDRRAAAAVRVPARGLRGAAAHGARAGRRVGRDPAARRVRVRLSLGTAVPTPRLAGARRVVGRGPLPDRVLRGAARRALRAARHRRGPRVHPRAPARAVRPARLARHVPRRCSPRGRLRAQLRRRAPAARRAARDGRLRLRGRFDALFLRAGEVARQRRLELRVSGRGSGVLYVGERGFWSPKTRWKEYPMGGAFAIRHPYYYPESGGPDLLVALGRDAGEAALDSVALVPANEPESVIRNP
jgi:hypothetical protein